MDGQGMLRLPQGYDYYSVPDPEESEEIPKTQGSQGTIREMTKQGISRTLVNTDSSVSK